jgi:hypothetical protein
MRGHPGLRARCARARPEALIELRNPVLYKVALSMDSICAHKEGLFSRKGVKDDLIKMIDLIVCGGKDGAFKEELVLSVGLIYIWISGIDQTLNSNLNFAGPDPSLDQSLEEWLNRTSGPV